MVDPLIFISDGIRAVAKNGAFFYLSLITFCIEFTLAVLYLLWLSTFPRLKKKKVNWLLGLYKICFLFDLFFCFTHSIYSQKFTAEISAVFLVCLIKYIVLIALYGLVWAHKWVLNEREKDAVNLKNAQKKQAVQNCDNVIFKLNEKPQKAFMQDKNSAKCKIADINIAYLRAVISGLKNKNLTDEERERICNLEFSLKAPLNNDCEAVKRLNGECEYLIKKMTEYGVSV